MLVQQHAPTRWSFQLTSKKTIIKALHCLYPPSPFTNILNHPSTLAWITMSHSSTGIKMHVMINIEFGYSSQDYNTSIATYLSPHLVSQANHQLKKKTNPKRNHFKEKKNTANQTHHQHHLPYNPPNTTMSRIESVPQRRTH